MHELQEESAQLILLDRVRDNISKNASIFYYVSFFVFEEFYDDLSDIMHRVVRINHYRQCGSCC